ncbi:MAG: glycerol kinase GlpK [Bdellovibrionaceae bacterium]|nr:glycerol kinase GlpK [Bdellovibrio sp.]
MKKYIMSIDQGTTSSRVVLVDSTGRLVSLAAQPFKQIYPKPGWVEHDANEIWSTVESSAKAALQNIKAQPSDLMAIGITNQRETVIAFRKSTGEPLHNAIVWQCRRTTEMCERLKKSWALKIKNKTGLVLDPYFSATKMRWLIENSPAVRKALVEKDLAFGTIDTFLMWNLSSKKIFATDVSNASRTMLMNLKTGQWDAELLRLFKVPLECLPEIKSSSGLFGYASNCSFAANDTAIAGVAGDQQAALFGQTCFNVGDSKCTFGTGSFILMNTGPKILKSKSGCLTTVAWRLGNQKMQYALEGGAFICGAAVSWLRDGLQLFEKSSEVEELAHQVEDAGGVEFVPALAGLGAPYWNPHARGEITGLTRGSTRAHIARATLEAMAMQNADILLAMQKDLGKKMKRLRVDGGASANNLLMQLQANYLGTLVDRPQQIETTAMGAAYLAGLGVGHWKNPDEIRKIWKIDKEFKSAMTAKALQQRRKSWLLAIKKSTLTN